MISFLSHKAGNASHMQSWQLRLTFWIIHLNLKTRKSLIFMKMCIVGCAILERNMRFSWDRTVSSKTAQQYNFPYKSINLLTIYYWISPFVNLMYVLYSWLQAKIIYTLLYFDRETKSKYALSNCYFYFHQTFKPFIIYFTHIYQKSKVLLFIWLRLKVSDCHINFHQCVIGPNVLIFLPANLLIAWSQSNHKSNNQDWCRSTPASEINTIT